MRKPLAKHHAWVGQRWLIAPHRAGGLVSIDGRLPAGAKAAKVKLLQTVAFLVDELTTRMRRSRSVEERTEILSQIQRVAALGVSGGGGNAKVVAAAWKKLGAELAKAHLLKIWSVPLASFDPVGNEYRELVFSYQ